MAAIKEKKDNNMVAIKDSKKYVLLKTLAEKNNEFVNELVTFYGSHQKTTEYGLTMRFGKDAIVAARDAKGKDMKAVPEDVVIDYIKSLLADKSGTVSTILYRINKAAMLNRALNEIDPESENCLTEGGHVVFKDNTQYMGLTYTEVAHKNEIDVESLCDQVNETYEAIKKATAEKKTATTRIKKLQKKLDENKELLKKSSNDAYGALDKLCGLTHQYEELVKAAFGKTVA